MFAIIFLVIESKCQIYKNLVKCWKYKEMIKMINNL